jgi:hypothetical protein
MTSPQHQHSTWISTASALPMRGQPVEFMLAARECPITGVYSGDGFRSRWTHYAPELVCRWRGAAESSEISIPASMDCAPQY